MTKNASDKVILYMKPTCPYCQKVLSALKAHGKSVSMKDVREEKYRDELIKIGGKKQVPCMVIDGNALYESDDIVDWIVAHLDEL